MKNYISETKIVCKNVEQGNVMPFPESPTLQVGSRCHLKRPFLIILHTSHHTEFPRRQDTMKVLVSYAHLTADFCYFFPSVGNRGTTKLRKNKVLFIIFSLEKNLRIILKCHFLSVSHISPSQGLSEAQTQEIKRKSEKKKKRWKTEKSSLERP